jgi:hypothetical protein
MLNNVQCKVKLAGNEILNGSTSLDSMLTLGVYGMDTTVCINRLLVSTIAPMCAKRNRFNMQ